jgi:hypothetical protein
MFGHVLWDTSSAGREGFRGGLWAARKLLVAILGAGLLTWLEWVEHHPPAILAVAAIHFVFVLAAIALVVYLGQRFAGRSSGRDGRQ